MKKMIFLLMLSTILEKFQWTFLGFRCSLFWIVGAFVSLFYVVVSKGKLKYGYEDRPIILCRVALIVYTIVQILFIQKSEDIVDQYTKGLVALIIDFLILFVGICVLNRYKSVLNFEYIIRCVHIICTINVVYNLVQRLYPGIDQFLVRISHSTVTRYGIDPYGQLGRLTGLFTDSNNNGVFLALSIIIYIYVRNCIPAVQKRKRVLVNAEIILALGMLFMTFSLTAYIALCLFIVLYLYHCGWTKKMNLLFVVGLGVIMLIGVYISNQAIRSIISAKITNMMGGESTVPSHLKLLFYSLEIWGINILTILFGTGNNCMSVYFGEIFSLDGYKAHNFYLQNLAEFGLIGFAIVMIYIYLLFKLVSDNRKKCVNCSCYWYLKCMLWILLVANLTYDSMAQNFFFMVVILLLSSRNLKQLGFPVAKKICNGN